MTIAATLRWMWLERNRRDAKERPKTHEAAPMPPEDRKTTQPVEQPAQQPAQVERPVDTTPAPSIPVTPPSEEPPLPNEEANPPMPPANDLFNPPAETTGYSASNAACHTSANTAGRNRRLVRKPARNGRASCSGGDARSSTSHASHAAGHTSANTARCDR